MCENFMCKNFDEEIVADMFQQITETLERTRRLFATIAQPDDFCSSDEGWDKLDAISMRLLAVGEMLKNIDRKTNQSLFAKYGGVDWTGFMGLRDVIAHEYYNLNPVKIFEICSHEIEPLLATVNQIINELEGNHANP